MTKLDDEVSQLDELRVTRSRRPPSRVRQKRKRYYRRNKNRIKRKQKRYRRRPRVKRLAKRRAKIRKRLHLRPGSRRRIRLNSMMKQSNLNETRNVKGSKEESTDMDEIKKLKEEFASTDKQDLIRGFNEAVSLAESLEKNFGKLIEEKQIVSKPLVESKQEVESEIPDSLFETDPLSFLPKDDLPSTYAFSSIQDQTQLDEAFDSLLKEKVFTPAPKKLTESQKKLCEAVTTVKSDLTKLAEDAKRMLSYVEAGMVNEDEANIILGHMVEYLEKTYEKVELTEAVSDYKKKLEASEVEHFLEEYPDCKDDLDAKLVDGEVVYQVKAKVAKDLNDTHKLFTSGKPFQEYMDEAEGKVKAEILKAIKKKNLKGVKVEMDSKIMDGYVGYDAGAIYATLKKGDKEVEFEPSSLYYSGANENADAMSSYTWAAWLMADSSPFKDDSFVTAHAECQIGQAMEQFSHTLKEGDFYSELDKALDELAQEESEETESESEESEESEEQEESLDEAGDSKAKAKVVSKLKDGSFQIEILDGKYKDADNILPSDSKVNIGDTVSVRLFRDKDEILQAELTESIQEDSPKSLKKGEEGEIVTSLDDTTTIWKNSKGYYWFEKHLGQMSTQYFKSEKEAEKDARDSVEVKESVQTKTEAYPDTAAFSDLQTNNLSEVKHYECLQCGGRFEDEKEANDHVTDAHMDRGDYKEVEGPIQNTYQDAVKKEDAEGELDEKTASSTLKKYEALKNKKVWSKQEILGVAHRMSDLDRGWKKDSMDEEFKYILHELLAMFEEGKTVDISPEQSQQGIDWLKKNIINSKGELRDTGMVREAGFNQEHADIIKNFKKFELVGFKHDEQSHIYAPIYRTIGTDGKSFDYSVSGGFGGAAIEIH